MAHTSFILNPKESVCSKSGVAVQKMVYNDQRVGTKKEKAMKKNIKKTTSLLATAVLISSFALSSGAMASMSVVGMNSSGANQKTKTPAKFSFVIETQAAELKHVKGNRYTLSVSLASIQSVLAFSQAPSRFAQQLTPAQYAQIIHSGENSFDKNPPNMSATFDNGVSAAFEINGYTKDATHITYVLTLLDQQEGPSNQSGQVSLFIDAQISFNPDTAGDVNVVPL